MGKIAVFVKARPGATGIFVERRCRCGMCFDTTGRTVSVTEDQLARLQADPQLIVTDAPALESTSTATDNPGPVETLPAAAPEAEVPTAPESEAPKAEAPASGTNKTASKTAAKKAG